MTTARRRSRPGRLLLPALLLTACTATEPSPLPAEPLPADQCPTADPRSGTAIDWVPFVVVDGVQLSTTYEDRSVLQPEQVGPEVGRVHCRIAGAVTDPAFVPRDGDAAHLAPGTALHAVVGTPAAVAAQEDGVWRLFTADAPP